VESQGPHPKSRPKAPRESRPPTIVPARGLGFHADTVKSQGGDSAMAKKKKAAKKGTKKKAAKKKK
jgi:hypothetical protein